MTFKMTKEHLYWWPVEVKVPATDVKDAGKFETMSLKLQFAAMDQDEVRALDDEIASLPAAERIKRQHEHLESVVHNWDDVVDEDGNQVAFNITAFRQAMQRTWFRLAIYAAYAASLAGDEARTKN